MSTEPRILTCKACGSEFEHVQKGRGRPPVYCPSCREARASKPAKAKVGRPKKEPVLTMKEGKIQTGDTVVRPLKDFFKDQATAVKYGTPLKVTAVLGDIAYVQHPAEKMPLPTSISRLVKVGWR